MKWYRYKLTVKHDAGIVHLFTVATSAQAAREIIMEMERCPRRSILTTKTLERIA